MEKINRSKARLARVLHRLLGPACHLSRPSTYLPRASGITLPDLLLHSSQPLPIRLSFYGLHGPATARTG